MKILLCILLFILFLIWTFLLINKRLEKIDKVFYNSISFKKSKDVFFKTITYLASTPYFIILCVILLLLISNKRLALLISIAMIIDAGIVYIIKHIMKRERPNIKRLVEENGYSYPSGHTFSATCFYGLTIFIVWSLSLPLILQILLTILLINLILTIAYSRIYLGVHYFSDTIGGLLISSSYLFLYIFIVSDILNFL